MTLKFLQENFPDAVTLVAVDLHWLTTQGLNRGNIRELYLINFFSFI